MKKTWNRPELTVHGSVESLTQARSGKKFGGNDGFVLIITDDISVPITDV
ncbi:MAG: lasso peptide [Waterburya sp.]